MITAAAAVLEVVWTAATPVRAEDDGAGRGQASLAVESTELMVEVLAGADDAGVGTTVKVSTSGSSSVQVEVLSSSIALELEPEGAIMLELVAIAATSETADDDADTEEVVLELEIGVEAEGHSLHVMVELALVPTAATAGSTDDNRGTTEAMLELEVELEGQTVSLPYWRRWNCWWPCANWDACVTAASEVAIATTRQFLICILSFVISLSSILNRLICRLWLDWPESC